MNHHLMRLIEQAHGSKLSKKIFQNRVHQGHLTRSDNPTSHLCVYFAAYDPKSKSVFIGHHKKSDLWLFNGGHMDPDETPRDTVVREAHEEWGMIINPLTIPNPQLITLTQIEHPEVMTCEWHYDFWHFLPFAKNSFNPKNENLQTEFFSYGWKSYNEAEKLLTSQPTVNALHYLKNLK